MELDFFEEHPPKVAAIKLDFGDDTDREVAEKLRAMPGVSQVAIEYRGDGRSIVINPHRAEPIRLLDDGWIQSSWLVCTPPPWDSPSRAIKLDVVPNSMFQRRYRRIEPVINIDTMNVFAEDVH